MLSLSTLALAAILSFNLAQACDSPPDVNPSTVSLIREFEGYYPDIYNDPTGNPTVGIGHLCDDSSCSEVPYPIPLNPTTAAELLQDDLKEFEACVSDAITATLDADQYGALCSWAFNVGCGNAEGSTLVERLNAGEDPDTVAEEELPKWDMAGGEELPGLKRRREAEVTLFTGGNDTTPALPC